MTSKTQTQKTKSDSETIVTDVFKKVFFAEPIFIQELPNQKLLVTIKNEQDIGIGHQGQTVESKEITFEGEADFQQFFLQTKQNTFIVVRSSFSLYDHISREPYLETKAEYQFQEQLKKALKLTSGHTYYLPGDSSDFVIDDVDIDDVTSQDLELRYEHDDTHFYLFILI